ncbi:DUF3800 domain-containing protein [Bacillus sp. FJAT-52991]|uniref:DUF3800 domain-containing protein n=1 Tax=Bacillus kandeliae TaxID=3129297 RepID=A0ABZ2NBD8_9BACI
MSFLLFFDESNKIDQPDKKFSYYGAYGGHASALARTTKEVLKIFKEINSKSELHFTEYTHDKHVKKYFKVLNQVINEDISINLLIVDNEDAAKVASQMNISLTELRSLFYVKIPERLFYGITRNIQENIDVKIKVDHDNGYLVLDLYTKLQEQMNAHAAYRNKKYKVKQARPQDSKKSIPLQIIDTFIGIVVFLMEKSYLENTNSTKIKSDLIYRFLIHDKNIDKFQEQIKLYQWTGNETLKELTISKYISEFLVFKTQYDIQELKRLNAILTTYPNMDTKTLRERMEYSNTMKNTLLGYKDELLGLGRNHFLLR